MNPDKGILGNITTITLTTISWLPVVNQVVQIIAGLVAIAVGVATFNYYHRKNKSKTLKDYADKDSTNI